ncbi:unnamed protein product [Strongylus vulgaris]|uniref:Uncharacterized protein n=1 Tax=Strongylus vulgaris TaxID=40348 RepID=A0A3P7L2P0_STRVU|nr:unnamed protein product [Strongylus vulgaris]
MILFAVVLKLKSPHLERSPLSLRQEHEGLDYFLI